MTPETPTGQAPPAPEPAAAPPEPAPPTPRRRLWVLVGVALLLVGGAAGFWWWYSRPEPPPAIPDDVKDGDVRRAMERARQKVLDDPRSVAAWGELGSVLLAHQCYREADRCFVEAARLDPTNARWPYCRFIIANRLEPDQALPLLRQAESLGAAEPAYQSALRLRLAEALLERGDAEEAEQRFRDELNGQPDNPRAQLGLGLCALARGDEATAATYLGQVRDHPAARKKATAQLAALARARGDRSAADELDRESAALPNDQDWPDPYYQQLGSLQAGYASRRQEVARLEREGRYAEAAEVYLRQRELEPTSAVAHMGAGFNLVRAGEVERGLSLLREAARLSPNDSNVRYRLGQALYLAAEKERQDSPSSAKARDWLREAVEQENKATELKADHSAAYLVWGRALMDLGEPAAAIAPLQKGVACRPEAFNLQLALGEAYLDAGKLPDAETQLENARKLDANDSRLTQALERLRKKKG
jgi:Flp pilus assembly protein TadD